MFRCLIFPRSDLRSRLHGRSVSHYERYRYRAIGREKKLAKKRWGNGCRGHEHGQAQEDKAGAEQSWKDGWRAVFTSVVKEADMKASGPANGRSGFCNRFSTSSRSKYLYHRHAGRSAGAKTKNLQ